MWRAGHAKSEKSMDFATGIFYSNLLDQSFSIISTMEPTLQSPQHHHRRADIVSCPVL